MYGQKQTHSYVIGGRLKASVQIKWSMSELCDVQRCRCRVWWASRRRWLTSRQSLVESLSPQGRRQTPVLDLYTHTVLRTLHCIYTALYTLLYFTFLPPRSPPSADENTSSQFISKWSTRWKSMTFGSCTPAIPRQKCPLFIDVNLPMCQLTLLLCCTR